MISWPRSITLLLGRPSQKGLADSADLRDPKTILVVRFNDSIRESSRSFGIGDLVLLSPFFRILREQYPKALISLVIDSQFADFYEHCPYVDEIVPYTYSSFYSFLQKVLLFRKRKPDLLFFPKFGMTRWYESVFCYLVRPRQSVAYSEHVQLLKEKQQRDYDLFFTDTLNDRAVIHEALRSPKLVYYALGELDRFPHSVAPLEVWPGNEDAAKAEKLLSSIEDSKIRIVLGLSARAKKRCWPISFWKEFISLSRERFPDIRYVVTGGSEIKEDAKVLAITFPDLVFDIAGATSCCESYEIMRRCDVYVGSDSGPMHMAAAAGLPCVMISCHPLSAPKDHSNAPERFGPYGVVSKILQPKHPLLDSCAGGCTATEPHCITQISPKMAVDALAELIAQGALSTEREKNQ